MPVQSYRELDVWQKSMDVVVDVYRLTKQFPAEERFGLTNQIQRSAVSIPANIAEGFGRLHHADYLRFLSIARGSLMETETHLQIAVRLDYIDREQTKPTWNGLQDVGRLLNGLIRALRKKDDPGEEVNKYPRAKLRDETEHYFFDTLPSE